MTRRLASGFHFLLPPLRLQNLLQIHQIRESLGTLESWRIGQRVAECMSSSDES
jgi:hypothetical protein